MVKYDTLNLLVQFGIFLATGLTAMIAIIALVANRKKK